MKHKDTWTNVLYIILFVAVFVLLQFLSRYLSAGCIAIVRGIPFRTAMNEDSSGTAVAVTTVISSLLTFALFTRAGFSGHSCWRQARYSRWSSWQRKSI